MIKFLLQALAFVTNKLPKTEWKPIPLCHVYAKYDLEAPNLVGHVTAPSVTTGSASSVGANSFTMGGEITSNGGENASVRGFVYSNINASPTTSDSVVNTSGSYGAGTYSQLISGLSQNTLYYVRAYATNSGGTGYGSTVQVTTANLGPPTVITNAASSITTTTATANGNISGTNGATVTERGFVWATSADPTKASNSGIITQTGSYGTGTFTGSMTGLSPSTLYYVRAYAINSYGTNYGSNQTFATASVPTLHTVGQYKSDFATVVPQDWYTGLSGVSENLYLQAEVSNGGDPMTSTVVGKAEIEQVGTPFDNVANRTTKSRTYRNDTVQFAKRGGTMVYDSHNKRYIFFGGYDGTTRYNEVWEKYMDVPGQPWNLVNPTGTKPVGRNLHGSTYVKANLTSGGATRAYMIVWGGADPNDLNDMWALRLDTPGSEAWTQITQTNAPSVRSYLANQMVATPGTDSSNNYIYLFGGWASTRENQLVRCTFDVDTPTAITWTTLKANGAAGNPTGRSGALLDYKASTGQLLLYGGNTGSMVNDFWIYTIATNTWQQRSVSGTAFTAAEAMAGGYDSINNRFWVTGGWTTSGNFGTSRNNIGYISNVGGSEAYVEVRANSVDNQSFAGHSFAGNLVDPDKGWLVMFQQATVDSTERYDYIIDFRETATSDFPVYSLSDGEFKNARDAMSSALNTDHNEWVQTGGFEDMYDNATIPNGTHSGDVWAYNPTLNKWRYAVKGFKAMPQVEGSYSCYDTTRDRIIVFGSLTGATKNGNDVWSLTRDANGNYDVKQLRPTGTRPSPRWLGFAVFDEANNRAIFGLGGDNSGPANDVWALNFSGSADGAWTQLSPTGSVTGVIGMAFGVAKNAKRVYIHGGATNGALSTLSSQTAYFDYSTTNGAWTTISTTNAIARRTPAADFDEANNTFIVYGGLTSSDVTAATSMLRLNVGTAWEHYTPVTFPAARRSVIGQLINNKFYIDSGRPSTGTWFNDTWEYTPDYTTPSNSVWVDRKPNIFMPVYFTFTGGTSGQEYHWQAWSTENSTDSAKVSFGTNTESDADFILGNAPPAVNPTVTSSAATNVTAVSATANGAVTDLGYEYPSERGFVYSLSSSADPTVSTNLGKIVVPGDLGSMSSAITGLSPSTGYKYRAYATNSSGTGYSSVQSFTTSAYSPATFTLAASMSISGGGIGYATLYNRTKGVALAEMSTTSSTPTLVTRDYEIGDTNFHDQDEYEIRVRTNGTGTVNLYSAKLFIRLMDLTKITTWNRISRFGSAALSTAAAVTSQRFLYTAGNYSNSELFWEITGQEDLAGTNDFGVYDVTTTDIGTSGTVIPETRVDVNSATKTRQRVNRISLTNGNRYLGIFNRSSGGARYQSGIIGITASGAQGTVDSQTMIELADISRSSVSTGTFTPLIFRTPFNPLDVDNATYYFEVIGRNANTSIAYDVQLLAVNGSGTETVAGSVSLLANTGSSNTRRRSGSITIPSDTVQLRVRLPQTAASQNIFVEGARLIIVQTNANRALVQIPLGGSANDANDETTWPMSAITSSTYVVPAATEDQYTIWKRDDSMYDRYVGLGKSPTVAQNTANAATLSSAPTLEFTGTDPESNPVSYEVQVSDSSSMSEFLDSSNMIIANVGGVTGDLTAIDRGQSFTTTSAGDMHSLVLYLSKFGSPTDGVQAKIYTDNAGAPGTLLGTSSNTLPLDSFPTSSIAGNFNEAKFYFDSGITLSAATRYWFVVDRTGAASSTNYYSIEGSSSIDYGSENGTIWNGTSWGATGVLSLIFKAYLRPVQNLIEAKSSIDGGFSGTPDSTDPFTSGQLVSYTAQSEGEVIVDSYGIANGNSNNSVYSGGPSYVSQSFMSSSKTKLKRAAFWLYKSGTAAGSVVVTLHAHTGTFGTNSQRSGPPLATSYETVDVASLSTTATKYEFTFSGYPLEANTPYVISVSPVMTSSDLGNRLHVSADSTSPTHQGNIDRGQGFYADDLCFEVYGTSYTPSDLSDGTYYWRVRGKDPAGSNLWGNWSTTRSFTVTGVANYSISHTTSSVKGGRSTKFHTTSSNKRKANNTLSHTTSAFKHIVATKTHTTNSFLRKASTVSHSTSAVKGGRYTKTHTTSAVKRLRPPISHTTDALKHTTPTLSHTTNALKRKQSILSHTTSSNKKKQTTVSHTTSLVKRKQFTKTHTTNTLLRKRFTRSHTTSSNKKKANNVIVHTTNALKRVLGTVAHTTNAYTRIGVQTIDTLHTTDALLRKQSSLSHATDSFVRKQNTVSHTTSSNKKKTGNTASHTTSAVIRKANVLSHSTSSNLKKTTTRSHTTSSNLKKSGLSVSHVTDSFLRKQTIVSHTTDANKRKSGNVVSHSTSANKRKAGNVLSHSTNTFLRKAQTVSHTTDANKKIAGRTVSHVTDTLLRKSNTLSHTTSSNKNKATTVSHTTSANKRVAGFTRSHTTSSMLRKRLTLSHSTNALKKIRNTLNHTTSALKRKTATLAHTTNALKKVQGLVSHTTSSFKRTRNTVSHTADARTYKRLFSELVDNFDDNVKDTAKWQGTFNETGGQATFYNDGTTSTSLKSAQTRSLIGNSLYFKYSAFTSGFTSHDYSLQNSSGTGHILLISHQEDGNIRLFNSAFTTLATWAYATGYEWIRFRESGGTFYVDTGTAPGAWTNRYSAATISGMDDAYFTASVGYTGAGGGKGGATGYIDNFNVGVAQFELAHSTDALKRKENTLPHTTDSLVRKQNVVSHSTSSNKKKVANVVSHTTSSILRKANVVSHSTNALKRKLTTVSHSTSANLRKAGLTVAHTTNTVLRRQLTRSHATDALKRSLNTLSHATDAFRKTAGFLSHATDAFKRTENDLTHTTDSLLRERETLAHTTNANKRKVAVLSHTTSSNKRLAGNTVSHTTNANKRRSGLTVAHTTNAALRRRLTIAHVTDAVLRKINTTAHTTDSYLRISDVLSHSTDTLKRTANVLSHSTNALKRTANVLSHTTSAFKRTRNTLSHTTNSFLRKINTVSHSTSANKRKANLVVSHTTSANKRKANNLVSHTTSVVLRKVNSLSHSTSSFLRRRLTASHATDSFLRARKTLAHATNSFLRKQNTVAHSTDSNKKKANNLVSHTTSALKRTLNTLSHTTSVFKRSEHTVAHVTDSFLRRRPSLSHSTDSFFRAGNTLTHSTDANKKKAGNTVSHTTSANKKKIGNVLSHVTDALLRRQLSLSHSTNALKRVASVLSHATDSLLRKAGTLSHLTDANKRRATTISHDTDSNLRRAYSVAHTTSANKRVANNTASHSTDANKRVAGNLVSHTTDVLKRTLNAVDHTTDALLRAQIELAHVTDALLRKANVVQHATDANKRKVQTAAHSTDSNKRKANNLLTHTTNAVLRKLNVLSHSTNALKKTRKTLSHATDSFLRRAIDLAHSTSSFFRKGNQVNHTTDANKRKASVVSHSTSANKRKLTVLFHTTNANLRRAGLIVSHLTDANKRRASNVVSHTTSSILRKANTLVHTTDALKRAEISVSHATDALKKIRQDLSHVTDSFLRAISAVAHSTDSNLKVAGKTVSHTTSAFKRNADDLFHTTDTVKRAVSVVSHTTDASKKFIRTVYHTTNSFLRKASAIAHTTSSVLRKVSAVSHLTDANKRKAITTVHTTNAYLRAGSQVSHSTDALKKRTGNIVSHTTSSSLRQTKTVSHVTDAFLRNVYAIVHATDSYLRRADSVSHTTSSVKKKANNLLAHLTSAVLRKLGSVSHDTDALLRQRDELAHLTDSYLRKSNDVSHSTDSNKKKADNTVSHSTDSVLGSQEGIAHTTDASIWARTGTKRILVNGVYEYGTVRVLRNGEWVVAEVYIFNGTDWVLAGS